MKIAQTKESKRSVFWKHTILTNGVLLDIMVLQGDGRPLLSTRAVRHTVSRITFHFHTERKRSRDRRYSYGIEFQPCRRTVLKKNKKYDKDFPRQLYTYFTTSVADFSIPSFSKFARSIGVTLDSLEAYRKHGEFDRAWRDCIEIRRDYLIDCALTRRHDPSFVKFLLDFEAERENEEDNGSFALTVKVEDS